MSTQTKTDFETMKVEDLIDGDRFYFGPEVTAPSMTVRAAERGDRIDEGSVFIKPNPLGSTVKVFFHEPNLSPILMRVGSLFSIHPRS